MNLARRSVAILHGGLGNQLFQFAAALSITEPSEPAQVRRAMLGTIDLGSWVQSAIDELSSLG